MWNKIKPYLPSYIIAVAIPLAVGITAAALTRDSMDIYDNLKVPPLAPPALAFPIVWSVLYVLMGVSSAGIYNKRELNPEAAKRGLGYYAASLVFNFAWSIIFFNLSAALAALICLGVLLYFIIRTILEYRKVAPWCAYLQIPYALWVAFAGYLNAGIWLLNQ